MGQAFRRAAGRLRTTTIDTSPSPSPSPSSTAPFQKSLHQRPPVVPTDSRVRVEKNDPASDGNSEGNAPKLEQDSSENRDSNYETMLNQMVGRISTKPGGKLEMGEAFVVRKSNRAMPKLRNTTPDAGRYEERPVSVGTLNVAQLRQILLLHQSKSDGQDKPVGSKDIADMFRLDSEQVKKILQFVSMPPESNAKPKQDELDD